jgi:hypothetical protein
MALVSLSLSWEGIVQENSFDPEVIISSNEQAALMLMSASEGFKVFNRIMRGELDKLIMSLINEPGNDDEMVLNKHKLAKSAAIFYDGIINRVNHEIAIYASQNTDSKPVDSTAHLIDLGPDASTQDDIENDIEFGAEESPFNL